MKIKTALIALFLFALPRAAFPVEKAEGKPCGSCAAKLAGSISLLEKAGVKAPETPPAPAAAAAGWEELGDGAWFSGAPAPGGTLFIGYAGYGADGAGARNWVSAVAAAKGWGIMVAVAGPDKLYYEDNEKLEANKRILNELIPRLAPGRIIIAAHSSGSFVSKEFMALLEKLGRKDLLHKISYYDLDGGPCGPCRKYADDPGNSGFSFSCVSASQPGGPAAPNIGSMKGCGKYYIGLEAEGAGCAGPWCLHGWLINLGASKLDAVRPKTREYYLSPSLSPCVSYFKEN
ncbi:MAG: hypothetical protein PHV36_08450 [Elusimicrobiales bacterium]|nr:hypothetical protein [Elusimicrobiales bacterium]